MSDNLINGAAPPPRDKRIYWIEKVDAGVKFQFTCYSPAVWGVHTHFHEGVSPCYENHKHCIGGHDPRSLRWQGYLFGWSQFKNKVHFLKVTQAAYEQLLEQIPTGQTLRGLVLTVQRTVKKKGRLYLVVEEYLQRDPGSIPKDIDPRPSIYNNLKLEDPGYRWAINPLRKAILAGPEEPPPSVLGHSQVS